MFEQFFSPVPIARPVVGSTDYTAADQYQQEEENARQQKQLESQEKQTSERIASEGEQQKERIASTEKTEGQRLSQQGDQWRQEGIDKLTSAWSNLMTNDPQTGQAMAPMFAGALGGYGVEMKPQQGSPASPGMAYRAGESPEEPLPEVAPSDTAMPSRKPGESLTAYMARWAAGSGYDPKTKSFEPPVEGEAPKPEHVEALDMAEQAMGMPPRPNVSGGPVFEFRDKKTGRTWTFDPSGIAAASKEKAERYREAALGTAKAEGFEELGKPAFENAETESEIKNEREPMYEKAADRANVIKRIQVRRGTGGAGADSKEYLRGQEIAKNEGGMEKLVDMRQGYNDATQVLSLLSKDKPNSAEVMVAMRKLIRASGDNRISDSDLRTAPGMQSIWDKISEWTSKGGEAPNFSLEEIERMRTAAEDFKNTWHQQLRGAYDRSVETQQTQRDLSSSARSGIAGMRTTAFGGMDFYNPHDFGAPEKATPKAKGGGITISDDESREFMEYLKQENGGP